MLRAPLVALAFTCACGFSSNETMGDTGSHAGSTGTVETTGDIVALCLPDGASEGTSTGDDPDNFPGDDGQCYCEPGFTWADPFDPNNFACVPVGTRSGVGGCGEGATMTACATDGTATCECSLGDTWCFPDNEASTRCCPDGAQQVSSDTDAQTSSSTTGSGSSGSDTSGSDTSTTTSASCPAA